MKLENALEFDLENNHYIILCNVVYNDSNYYFANKIVNDEPTDEYRIVTKTSDSIEFVLDNELVNKLLPLIQKELGNIMKEGNHE